MINQKTLSILGKTIPLLALDKSQMEGLSVGDKLTYSFYSGCYMNVPMIFLCPKGKNPTPRICDITSQRVSSKTGLPTVFVLNNGPTYERQRLLDKGVYFVMSAHFAHLPMLVALEKSTNKKPPSRLTPVAQYMLLYHLQVASVARKTAKQLQEALPYSYASITLGMTCLDQLGLACKRQLNDRSNVIEFIMKGEELWNAARDYLTSPVQRKLYCDALSIDGDFPVASINALAHYSRLNPDVEQMIAVTNREFKNLESEHALVSLNTLDGNIVIEVWKYAPLLVDGATRVVDPLSLSLSLKDDDDPRVEEEVEQMIKNIVWKD